jgi:hypothetical protein
MLDRGDAECDAQLRELRRLILTLERGLAFSRSVVIVAA